MLSAVMQLAMGIGVACGSAVLDFFVGQAATPGPEVLDAFHNTFLVLAAMSAVSSFIFFQARHTTGFARRAPEPDRDHAPE